MSPAGFVFFDADQTLFDFHTTTRRALRIALAKLRELRPAAASLTVDDLRADRDRVAAELSGHGADLERIRLAAFAGTIRRCGRPDQALAEHLTEVYLRHRFDDLTVYPDVLPTLEILRRSYGLGVLSNGNSHPDRSGLSGWFSVVVLAHEHGVEKPDPRLFQRAARETAFPASRIVMVGDSLEQDVLGAQAVGWRGIWLDRIGSAETGRARPDATITTLREVPEVLSRIIQAKSP